LFRDAGADDVGRRADEGAVATEAGAERESPDQRLNGDLCMPEGGIMSSEVDVTIFPDIFAGKMANIQFWFYVTTKI
jgi:hypothetical protein